VSFFPPTSFGVAYHCGYGAKCVTFGPSGTKNQTKSFGHTSPHCLGGWRCCQAGECGNKSRLAKKLLKPTSVVTDGFNPIEVDVHYKYMNLIKIHSRPNEPKYPHTTKEIVGLPIKFT